VTEDDLYDEIDDEAPKMWKEYHRQIDQRLDRIRPQRAGAGEKEWREAVYGWARNHIPDESTIVRHFAEQEVDRREAQATRRGNAHLRQWMEGQIPLVWNDIGCLPVKITRDLRVRLDAVTPQDLDDAARLVQDAGLQVYTETLLLAEAERDLASRARQAGLVVVALLGDLPPRVQAQAA